MSEQEQSGSRASRALDDLMGEGGGKPRGGQEGGGVLPVLPRVRLVLPGLRAPATVRKKEAAPAKESLKPASQLLPEILKQVEEERKRLAAEREAKRAAKAAAAPQAAAVAPKAVRLAPAQSRIRRRFDLVFGKVSTAVFKPRGRAAVLAEGMEDRAIYTTRGEEKPLRVPDHFWEKPGLVAWLFLAPGLLAFLLFSWLPMARGVWLSLHDVSLTGASRFVGLENYARALHDPLFWQTLWHAALFSGLSLVMGFAAPLALAIYANELRRGQGLLKLVFFLPFLTPTVPAVVLWRWVFDQGYGLLNSLLSYLPIADPRVPWLNDPTLAMLAVVTVFVWKNTGWSALIYLAALRDVPEELYETAELDGTPLLKRVWHVSLPSLRATMGLLLIMQVISTFQVFSEVFLLTGGGPVGSTEMIATYMYKKSFLYLDIGYASALAVMLFMLLVSFSTLRLRSLREE